MDPLSCHRTPKSPDAFQTWQSLRYIDTKIPAYPPVQAKGVTGKDNYLLSTTNWQPYTWSINNVALAENLHTALAYWQGNQVRGGVIDYGRALCWKACIPVPAPAIFSNCLSMMLYGVSYTRDFADPIGMAAPAHGGRIIRHTT